MTKFKDLIVWRKAYQLALDVYQATKSFPKEELYGIVSQIRRASVSVVANIAEGHERRSRKEFLHFLSISRGSLSEVEAFLMFSRDLSFISGENYTLFENDRQEVGKLLNGLIKSLEA